MVKSERTNSGNWLLTSVDIFSVILVVAIYCTEAVILIVTPAPVTLFTENSNFKEGLSTDINLNGSPKAEYSLKQTFFDPSKSSPPNEFMIKLRMRMNIYNSSNSTQIKDDSRDIE